MSHGRIDLRTEDGTCPAHVFSPETPGRWPGVLFFMDGIGIRPALFEMGERMASAGYHVLLPDLYYRTGFKAPGNALFTDPVIRDDWRARVLPTVSIANIMRDVPAFLRHLETSAELPAGRIGVTGYCLGGRLSFAAAGHFPDRVAAAASYHPSGLATEAPDSPHRLAPAMQARVYVAGAIEDAGFDDAQKQRLEDALTAAGVDHRIETYDARHGWVPSDTPAHDPAAAERHWRTLFDLFGGTIGRG
ncbi:MAG: dienelactone hydrolase family protein [Gemmatimonadaceae bacterium]|nr:dienelactone hydrolase family protein [Gemmatimonadaceae bacterium]